MRGERFGLRLDPQTLELVLFRRQGQGFHQGLLQRLLERAQPRGRMLLERLPGVSGPQCTRLSLQSMREL